MVNQHCAGYFHFLGLVARQMGKYYTADMIQMLVNMMSVCFNVIILWQANFIYYMLPCEIYDDLCQENKHQLRFLTKE